jgi:hypothetical protein
MIFSNNKLFNIKDVLIKSKNIKSEYESFSSFCNYTIDNNDNGFLIDRIIIKRSAINVIIHDDISGFNGEFLTIKINNASNFIKLAIDANENMIMFSFEGEAGIVAYYNSFLDFPVARLYTYQFTSQEEFQYITQNMDELGLNYKLKEHDKLIDKDGAKKRVSSYKKEQKERYKYLENFAQGRIDNTNTTGGMIIVNEDNSCVSCNKRLSENIGIENISFLGGDLNILFIMEVCRECVSNSEKDNILLNSIFQVADIEKKFENRQLTIEEIREYSRNIVRYYLQAEIDLEKSTIETISAVTPSGHILKLRLDDISDYGYSILSSEEEPLIQFDNAKHHEEILDYSPHHVHNNKPNEKILTKLARKFRKNKKKRKEILSSKDITDSFLTGYLGLDFVSIKNRLEELEK